jgi:rhomboid protease GluP
MTSATYIIALLCAFFAGSITIEDAKRKFPYITVLVCLVLAFCFVLQLCFPQLLLVFERNTVDIEARQWWRVVTALFFQDGGWVGAVSNIFFLGLIGFVAEQLIKKWQWLVLYFVTGIATEGVAMVWQPIGAGNSIAVFGLAAGICAYVLLVSRTFTVRALVFISVLSALFLFTRADIHGAAFCIGAIISAAIFFFKPAKSSNIFPDPQPII